MEKIRIIGRLWAVGSRQFKIPRHPDISYPFISIRSCSRSSGFRFARKVYELGERIPSPGDKRKVVMDTGSETDVSSVSSSFNSTMSEITKNSRKTKKIVLEGARLIEDALLVGLKMEKLFLVKSIKEVPDKIKTLMTEDVEIQRVGQKQMQLWSSVIAPPGLIGIFPKPTQVEISKWTSTTPKLPVTLICDNVREPGNLGSILRSAAGAGCKGILLSKGSVDPWEGKVLRGGSGAHFRLPIISDIPIFDIGSHMNFGSSPTSSIGILLADSNFSEKTKFEIPSTSYRDVDYRQFEQIYVVVGGESEGIGDDTLQIISSLKTTYTKTGVAITLSRIHISLENNVESLNVANAFGIITFEIKRQLELFKTLE